MVVTPTSSLIILIPIYQIRLSGWEELSLRHSLKKIKFNRQIFFIAPSSLNAEYYLRDFPSIQILRFPDEFFISISGYNRLLLNLDFYKKFSEYEFLLILQPDAIILNDKLDSWICKPFDYVGAPWPDGYTLSINWDRFSKAASDKNLKVHVGNGGLSLRRTKSCIDVICEFPEAHAYFLQSGSSEDLFFSFMGSVSESFLIPNEIVAAEFSRELNPGYYTLIGVDDPLGGHAWWKYDLSFWIPFFDQDEKKLISTFQS